MRGWNRLKRAAGKGKLDRRDERQEAMIHICCQPWLERYQLYCFITIAKVCYKTINFTPDFLRLLFTGDSLCTVANWTLPYQKCLRRWLIYLCHVASSLAH